MKRHCYFKITFLQFKEEKQRRFEKMMRINHLIFTHIKKMTKYITPRWPRDINPNGTIVLKKEISSSGRSI